MVKAIHVAAAALAAALAAPSSAQEARPLDAAQAALVDFYDCTKRYSEKYAKSREPAQDIADAALSFCETPRERARTLLIDKLSVGGRSAREQVNSLFPGIIEKSRLLSIRTIVEARYEASLNAASAPAAAPLAPSAPLLEKPLAPPPPPLVSSAPPDGPRVEASVGAAPGSAPQSASVVPPTPLPGEAVAIPYVDPTVAPPPGQSPPGARPDPGAFPPDVIR